MPINIGINKTTDLISVIAEGDLTFEEILLGLTRVVEHPDFVKNQDVIWDFRNAKPAVFPEPRDIRLLADHMRNLREKRGSGYKVAVIASEDHTFGLARMYEAYSDRLPFELTVFRDAGKAYEWLNDKDS